MQILRHKNFKKQYKKLDEFSRKKVNLSIKRFHENPFNPLLKNHKLNGSMSGRRAISVTGDLRIIFEEYDDYVTVLMLDIGTHNQVYL